MLNNIGTQAIQTERLILRRFKIEDWKDMQKYWVRDPNVQLMYCEPVYEAEDEIKGLLKEYIEKYKSNENYRWAIINKKTGICMGQIAFFMVNSTNHFAEIEYCIGVKFQNKGYVTEAVNAILDFGFNTVEFNRIQISHRKSNLKSKRVIEKVGFVYEGNFREYFHNDVFKEDRLFYSLLKSEWKADKS